MPAIGEKPASVRAISRAESLRMRFRDVRDFSKLLTRDLEAEDCVVQSMPDVSAKALIGRLKTLSLPLRRNCWMKLNRLSHSAFITNSNIRNCSLPTSSMSLRKIRCIRFFENAPRKKLNHRSRRHLSISRKRLQPSAMTVTIFPTTMKDHGIAPSFQDFLPARVPLPAANICVSSKQADITVLNFGFLSAG